VAASITPRPSDFARVRDAMASGRLDRFMRTATAGERAALYMIVYHLVFRVVQIRERVRGHSDCAGSPERMRPECHDQFLDNVETMLEDLLRHAHIPVANAEGWLRSRFNAVTVDANRRRRGRAGALQRPRMPQWLDRLLTTEWHRTLALEIMNWVGVPQSAGLSLWPLNAWAALRDQVTGTTGSSDAEVMADINIVLRAMRTNAPWFSSYIERPIGHKQTGVVPAQRTGAENSEREPDHLDLVSADEHTDALLRRLAAVAVNDIADALAAGGDVNAAVVTALTEVFVVGSGADGLAELPGAGTDHAELVERLLANEENVRRIAKTVIEILREQALR
jgi:hypothetical protein